MNLSNQNVIHIKKEGIQYLQFKKLLEYKEEIKHAYSLGIDEDYRTATVKMEPLEKSKYEKMINAYNSLCTASGMKIENIVKPNQEHTNCVKAVTKKINKNEPDFNLQQYAKTDGLITEKNDIILATTNADCILMMFFDPVKKVIANTHSGWKGTLQRISIQTIKKMQEEYGCNPRDIICCICPSIRQCHFEVDIEVKDKFEKEFEEIIKATPEIIKENKPKWNIDTVLINKILLEEAGLKPENIMDSGICSVCNSEIMHSYRVEKEGYGVNVALIQKF